MATTPFKAALTALQSGDGKTVTFYDISPYGAASNEGYLVSNFVRSIILTDAYSNQLAVLAFNGTALTTQYAMSADQWVYGELLLAGINPVPSYNTPQIGFPFDRITKNLYRTLLKAGCCQNKAVDRQIDNADDYLFGSSIEALSGNGAGFNVDVQAAYSYLSAPNF